MTQTIAAGARKYGSVQISEAETVELIMASERDVVPLTFGVNGVRLDLDAAPRRILERLAELRGCALAKTGGAA